MNLGNVRRLFDDIQQVAGPDRPPLGKFDGVQITLDAGLDIHGLNRFDPAHVGHGWIDGRFGNYGHLHQRRRSLPAGLGAGSGCGGQDGGDQTAKDKLRVFALGYHWVLSVIGCLFCV